MTEQTIYVPESEELFPNPRILLHPQIPKPLHLLNPRTLLGQDWWDIQRKAAYKLHDNRCHACGVHKTQAWYRQWLEGHEMYLINYSTGEMRFIRVVALCHACHNYIHQGRLAHIFQKGEVPTGYVDYILQHGHQLTRNLRPFIYPKDTDCCEWSDWHLVIEDKNYGQQFHSYEEWRNHQW